MAKNEASVRVAEGGMTEQEAAYFASGGNAELAPPADTAISAQPSPEPAAPAVPEPAAPQQQAPAAPAADPAAAAPAPAPAAVDEDDDAPADPNAQIPYQKYARERKKLRDQLRERDDRLTQTTASLSDLQQKWARVDERLRLYQEAAAPVEPAAAQPTAPPDPETDPFGYMKWLGEQVTGIKGQTEQVVSQTNEQQAYAALTTTFRTDAQAFARTAPDFLESTPGARDGAYHYLMKNRDAELQAAGYTDPAERLRIITLDERDIVARALHAKQNNPQAPGPAQVLYGLAKARGYQPRAAAPAAPSPAQNGMAAPPAANGAAAPAPAAPGGAPSVTDQVAAIQRGQAASRSLSAGGGAPVPQGLDLTKLSSMSDQEYLDWKVSLTPAQRKEYQGLIGAPA